MYAIRSYYVVYRDFHLGQYRQKLIQKGRIGIVGLYELSPGPAEFPPLALMLQKPLQGASKRVYLGHAIPATFAGINTEGGDAPPEVERADSYNFV